MPSFGKKKKEKAAEKAASPPKAAGGNKKGMKDKAKDKMAEHEANKQLKWRTVVMDNPGAVVKASDDAAMANEIPMDVAFRGLDGWVEGQKAEGDAKPKSATKQKLEDKARLAMLAKVHNGITKKIMMTLLEVCSKVMETTEDPMRKTNPTSGVVVNALNGVLLSYYFGFNKKKQFVYLRRFASDQMAKNMSSYFDTAGDSSKAAAELTAQLTGLIREKEAMATEMVTAAIQKAMEAEVDLPVPEGMGDDFDQDAMMAKVKALMASLSTQGIKFAVSKMDTTILVLVEAIGNIIEQVDKLYTAAKGGDELDRLEKLDVDGNLNEVGMAGFCDSVFEVVSGEYTKALQMVSDQTAGIVAVLDNMMGGDDGGDEEE